MSGEDRPPAGGGCPDEKRRRLIPRIASAGYAFYFLFVGSLMIVAARWEPWAVDRVLEGYVNSPDGPFVTPDLSRIILFDDTPEGSRGFVCDMRTGERLYELEAPQPEGVRSAYFTPHGARIVTLSGAEIARIHDGSTGAIIAELPSPDGMRQALRVRFSPDGRYVVVSYSRPQGSRVLVDASNGEYLCRLPAGPLAFSPDGQTVAVGQEDGDVTVLASRPGRQLGVLRGTEAGGVVIIDGRTGRKTLFGVSDLCFSPDGKHLLVTYAESKTAVWDASEGGLRRILQGKYDVFFSPDGRFLAGHDRPRLAHPIDSPREIHIEDTNTGGQRVLHTQQSVIDAAVSLRLWDATVGGRIGRLPGEDTIAFSADGSRLLTVHGCEVLRFWDTETGRERGSLRFMSEDEKRGSTWMDYSMEVSYFFSPRGEFSIHTLCYADTRIWSRRYPRGWSGHLHRPEVWATILFGCLCLWRLARWTRARLSRRSPSPLRGEGQG